MTGLLLAGGGARAAYQVGVLEAIAALRRHCGEGRGPNPFPIITGTSAGAINGAALACGADHFERAVRRIARMWSHIRAGQVYHADSLHVMQSGARWLTLLSLGWALARWKRTRPHSLLNNAPLERLLAQVVPLVRRLAHSLKSGAATIGAGQLAQQAKALEHGYAESQPASEADLAATHAELQRVCALLAPLLPTTPTAPGNAPVHDCRALFERLQTLLENDDAAALRVIEALEQLPAPHPGWRAQLTALRELVEDVEYEDALAALPALRALMEQRP